MDPKTVRKLEQEIEKRISDVFRRLDLKKLPLFAVRANNRDDGKGGGRGLPSVSGLRLFRAETQFRLVTIITLALWDTAFLHWRTVRCSRF
jgi:hypothetical protein